MARRETYTIRCICGNSDSEKDVLAKETSDCGFSREARLPVGQAHVFLLVIRTVQDHLGGLQMHGRVQRTRVMKTDPDPRASSTPTVAPSRSLFRDAVLEQLRRFKQARGADFRVSRLGVFGSVARDEAGAESDVDVVFETDDPNLFRTAHLRLELEEWLGYRVDIVRLRPTMRTAVSVRGMGATACRPDPVAPPDAGCQ